MLSLLTPSVLASLDPAELAGWLALPADQQPPWPDSVELDRVRRSLAGAPALTWLEEVDALRDLLAEAACGERLVLQAGDCAEDPTDCMPDRLLPKLALIDRLAGELSELTGRPVTGVGRLAGQFAKPRSAAAERVGSSWLPTFRGLTVNAAEPEPTARVADPRRLITGYHAAATAMGIVRGRPNPIWTSHDAVLLDYELPLTRRASDGRLVLSSTHFPWVGERTRQPTGGQVRLLAAAANPVACKVGPAISDAELVRLCAVLDPERTPGRLTLIARLGVDQAHRLAGLVAAVAAAGHPVCWLCDPMHGNTVRRRDGRKSRVVEVMTAEVTGFCRTVAAAGGVPAGLHLESTPEPVAECAWTAAEVDELDPTRFRSLCDPRLTGEQALAVVRAWRPSPRRSR